MVEDKLQPLRVACAKLIGALQQAGHPLIYMDETTLNSWLTKSRSWSYARTPVLGALNAPYFSTTIYGALGSCLENNATFMSGRSTNAEEFVKFLHQVKSKVKPEFAGMHPVMILDNASAHISKKKSLPVLLELFDPCNTPPYSCKLNSIEQLWSYVKRLFKCKLMEK